MKKPVIAVLAVLFVAPAVMAKDWGIGVKLGAGQNDPKDLKNVYDTSIGNKELDKNAGFFGLEVLHEWVLNDEANKLGLKVGWDMYGENKTEAHDGVISNGELKETTYSFPFTVYYKRDNGVGKISWFGGAGVTIIRTKIEGTGYINLVDVNDDESKTKVFPHIVAGGEYRFTNVFALGLEARYNFAAKVKKDGAVLSDRSGFGGALTGRFYF